MNMFKRFVVGFVAVLAVMVMAIPANAQSLWRYLGVCPPGDELCRVMVGNQQMIRDMQSGYMGYFRGNGFYAAYDPYGRPLPRLVRIAVGAGIGASIGGGVGDLFGHGRQGALIGAGIGALIGIGSGKKNQQQPSVGQEGQQVRIGADGVPVAVGQPVGRVSPSYGGYQSVATSVPSGPRWNIRNMTGGKGELFDGGQFIKVLESGESYGVPNPSVGYRLVILVPTQQGDLESREAVRQPRRDGWDMIVPAIQ